MGADAGRFVSGVAVAMRSLVRLHLNGSNEVVKLHIDIYELMVLL